MSTINMAPTPSNQPTYRLGLDIGGTKMLGVLLDDQQIIEHYRVATPKEDGRQFWIMAAAVLKPLLERAAKDGRGISNLGIGLAGSIDFHKQKLVHSPNLMFLNGSKPIDKLQAIIKLNCPIVLDNDANCFVKAEALMGAGKKFSSVYGLTIGTGIGGGLSLNGEIIKGEHGGAGEPGALLVDYDHKLTLEAAYQKLTQNNTRLLAQKAYDGDLLADKIFKELGDYLGMALASIVNIVDPGIIIIGGGSARAMDLFMPSAKRMMEKYINHPGARQVKVVKAKLGELAGAIGAALLN